MPTRKRITLTFERRLLEHPAAYHLRRMRIGLWLYLDLLSRLPAGADTLDVDPAIIAREIGLTEPTVRSWLGHLRARKYLDVRRLDGTLRVRVGRLGLPEPQRPPTPRFFTQRKLERALGETGNAAQLEEALRFEDTIIKRALAGALAVPDSQIRKSRTALFIFLLKRYANGPYPRR